MDDRNRELVKYFIEETNKKFDKLEYKVDLLLKFKWQVIGVSGLLSLLVTIGIQVIFNN